MENNWLSEHKQALNTLVDVCDELNYLSKAFLVTGNESMAKQLIRISEDIADSIRKADAAISRHNTEEFDFTKEHSGKILAALLEKTFRG